MSELTSIIMISCFEIIFIGKFVSHIWRIFYDNKLSIVLTNLETIHEKLIRLNVVGTINIKINWIYIIGIILNVMYGILQTVRMKNINQNITIHYLVIITVTNTCHSVVFYEHILLILYTKWIVFKINEKIPERGSCLSTYRDLYLDVIECLNDVNKSIYGLSAIVSFIAANISNIIIIIYGRVLFPRGYDQNQIRIIPLIDLLKTTTNILTLYMIGHATEKEINGMSLVLHQRSVIERNPRIKRQIKFFLLRRLHEHFHFKLYGMCHINLRQLLILSNGAIGYLVIQILFKLNK
eukprot:XP_016663352.1 PREDICTED: uncharacterized protein LOC100571686 isoform X1 [Acyrthosiphon pisum]